MTGTAGKRADQDGARDLKCFQKTCSFQASFLRGKNHPKWSKNGLKSGPKPFKMALQKQTRQNPIKKCHFHCLQPPLDLEKPWKTKGKHKFFMFQRFPFCILGNLKKQPKRYPKWWPKSSKIHSKGDPKCDTKKALKK